MPGKPCGPAIAFQGDNVISCYRSDSSISSLKDPATAMQPLPYKTIGMYINIKGCAEPNPAVRGYFLIEVWDQQVNVGYGGNALALRDLAIQTLEREMEGMR